MKPKNQPPISSEIDAKEKLIVYVYEYLINSNAKRAAQAFIEDIQYEKEIQINPDGPGFLASWWCVFWDLYCAAPDKRNQPEPSGEARAWSEFNMRTVMSPSCTQTSPPQQGPPFMGGAPPGAGGPMMGARYAPHPGPQLRGGPPVNVGPRMQSMPPQGPPQMSGPLGPHPPMMGAGSPRYAQHPGHMTPNSSTSSGPMGPEPGPSPGVNRMTPNHSGSPHPQVGPPPQGMSPMPPGPPVGPPHGGPPQRQGPGGSVQAPPMQQRGGPPPQGWQSNFSVNSPADQQCFMTGPPVSAQGQQSEFSSMMMGDGGMMEVKLSGNSSGPSSQQQDEYVMPNAYGQNDQGEAGQDIMKLKESLENNTKEYSENDQTGYNIDYPESQGKW